MCAVKVSIPKIDKDGNYSVIEVEKWRLLVSGWQNKGNIISLADTADKVGIGLSAVPKAGIGWAKLGLDGTKENSGGPHVQFTLSDATDPNYPIMQMFMYDHDNIGIAWDAYYDGGWKSSDGSNCLIYKWSNKLDFRYDSSIGAGSDINWNSGFLMDLTNGAITIPGILGVTGAVTFSSTLIATGVIRSNDAFNHNGTVGIDNTAAGQISDVDILGGIITSVTKVSGVTNTAAGQITDIDINSGIITSVTKVTGVNASYSFGGGGSGDVSDMTVTNGIITSVINNP